MLQYSRKHISLSPFLNHSFSTALVWQYFYDNALQCIDNERKRKRVHRSVSYSPHRPTETEAKANTNKAEEKLWSNRSFVHNYNAILLCFNTITNAERCRGRALVFVWRLKQHNTLLHQRWFHCFHRSVQYANYPAPAGYVCEAQSIESE